MDTVNKIFELINKKGMTINSFAVDCKINTMLFTHWKKGRQKPGLEVLIKIADYFNVSLDYLVGRETPTINDETNTANKAVNPTLLSRIESLDELQQAKVMAYIDGLQDTNNNDLIAAAVNRGIANKQKDKSKIS